MKGITPVVAVILLLLITISIVGFAFGFFQRLLGTAGTGVENQTQAVIGRVAQTISIDNVDAVGNKVTVRNTGTANIATGTELTVFVGGTKIDTCNWGGDATVEPKTTSTCTWTGTPCSAGTTLKVVAPGNEDSRKC